MLFVSEWAQALYSMGSIPLEQPKNQIRYGVRGGASPLSTPLTVPNRNSGTRTSACYSMNICYGNQT